MEFSDLELGPRIGGGRFGVVLRGHWKHWDGAVAIKLVDSFDDKEVL